MQKFTNPLDGVKIASPCDANWNEMRGNERKKYCAMCKLNVYNLSEMTQTEAENFLINSEGRICLRVFRRADGTVITQDCPVGWARIKRKVSRTATATFALVAGFFGGIFALESLKTLRQFTNYDKVPEPFFQTEEKRKDNETYDKDSGETISFGGMMSNLTEVKANILKNQKA
jgi:hypothetical protein